MKPIKLQRMKKMNNLYSPKCKVWYQKNDDERTAKMWKKALEGTLNPEDHAEHERENARRDVKRREEQK